jgi:hypothetical protein
MYMYPLLLSHPVFAQPRTGHMHSDLATIVSNVKAPNDATENESLDENGGDDPEEGGDPSPMGGKDGAVKPLLTTNVIRPVQDEAVERSWQEVDGADFFYRFLKVGSKSNSCCR